MPSFSDDDILKLDARFALENIPFHARPLHAAREILGNTFVLGTKGHCKIEEIRLAYTRLIPEVEFTWPGKGTGLVASNDRVRKVTIGVVFGTPQLMIHRALGFSSQQEWATWCRGDPKIEDRSAFAFADMHDLVYGIDRGINKGEAATYWGLAAGQLKLVAENLSQSGSIGSPVLQSICLTAELSMKGSLLHLGVAKEDLKNAKLFGHNLVKLGEKMTRDRGHRDDPLLLNALSRFPDYVDARYRETHLTRLEVIALALDAQFVSASAVRRISGEDLAHQIEITGVGPRSGLFT